MTAVSNTFDLIKIVFFLQDKDLNVEKMVLGSLSFTFTAKEI